MEGTTDALSALLAQCVVFLFVVGIDALDTISFDVTDHSQAQHCHTSYFRRSLTRQQWRQKTTAD